MITTYLFDLDGTLVDSERLKARALAETCRTFGGAAEETAYREVMGQNWERVTSHFFEKYGINPDKSEFESSFRPRYNDLIASELTEMPGALEFVRTLKRAGFKTGLVSSAARWMVDLVCKKLDLEESFDTAISREDVTNHKPDPEAYLLAIYRLASTHRETLVFEDSDAGVTAALAAKCACIGIRHAYNSGHEMNGTLAQLTSFRAVRRLLRL